MTTLQPPLNSSTVLWELLKEEKRLQMPRLQEDLAWLHSQYKPYQPKELRVSRLNES